MDGFISERSIGTHNGGGYRKSVRDGGFCGGDDDKRQKTIFVQPFFSVAAEGKWKKIPKVAAVARSLSRYIRH